MRRALYFSLLRAIHLGKLPSSSAASFSSRSLFSLFLRLSLSHDFFFFLSSALHSGVILGRTHCFQLYPTSCSCQANTSGHGTLAILNVAIRNKPRNTNYQEDYKCAYHCQSCIFGACIGVLVFNGGHRRSSCLFFSAVEFVATVVAIQMPVAPQRVPDAHLVSANPFMGCADPSFRG